VALVRRHRICRSVAQHPAGVLLVQFVGDAFVGEADKLCERRVRPTRTARQRWDEAANRGPRVAIEGPQIDGLRRVAGRTAHPKKPMPCLESAADGWREQHRHALGLLFIPRCDEAAGVPSRTWASVARFAAASFPVAVARCASILQRLKPMLRISPAVRRESSERGILSVIRRWRAREGNTCHSQRLISQIMSDSTALARASAENLRVEVNLWGSRPS
jgi:hypothetical protein